MARRITSLMPRIRFGLIACALMIAVALSIFLVRREEPTLIGLSPAGENPGYYSETFIHLVVKEFHPAGNVFTGSATIEIAPQPERMKSDPARFARFKTEFNSVLLKLNHYDGSSGVFQGGTDGPVSMAFPPAWGSLMGKGSFSWSAKAHWGPFFYPFDRYVLHVNPSLLRLSEGDPYLIDPIDILDIDFGASNLVPRLIELDHHSLEDPYEITLERPAVLIALALIVSILLVAWLLYLIFAAKAEENAGNIVGLFVGVFSIRSSLLSGAPVFPGLIDYCALAIYLAAVLIVLIKYVARDPVKTKDCPLCVSTIPEAALACPQCTRMLPQA